MSSSPAASLKLSKAEADIFVPDGESLAGALGRSTHLCVAAHQDDVEILASHGILECFGRPDKWFAAVIATDGAGSARSGIYQNYSDEQMREIRKIEQRKAAFVGEYSCAIQLAHKSSEVKNGAYAGVLSDLKSIFAHCAPEIVYLHNPADRHDTHVGTFLRALSALRSLPESRLPRQVLGCEVWRDLDWLPESRKIALQVSSHQNIQTALLGVFDSQIEGGKRYDLAVAGRRLANATFHESHAVDKAPGLALAVDLMPLVLDKALSPGDFLTALVEEFKSEAKAKLAKLS